MLKRLPYIILALIVGTVYSLGSGLMVRAASPVFYDGSVTWAIGRRQNQIETDFDYTALVENLPVMRSTGGVYDELAGIPWSGYSNSTFHNLPGYIAVHSRDLSQNGGYIYLAFAYGYKTDASISNVSISTSNLVCKRYVPGSFDIAMQYGTAMTVSANTSSPPNTYVSVTYSAPPQYSLGVIYPNITPFDGANFAQLSYFVPNYTYLEEFGINGRQVYDFGTTSQDWIRSRLVVARITVPAFNITSYNDHSVFWIDISSVFSGNFTSQNYQLEYGYGENFGHGDIINCKAGSLVYLLPINCYATSTAVYLDVEEYLAQIVSGLNNMTGGSPPQSVLESYAALGSEAREAAHAAASQMAQNYPTYDPSAMDISNIVDPTAKSQFKSIMGFLTNNKIVRILGVVFTLVLIGFVFFGKK